MVEVVELGFRFRGRSKPCPLPFVGQLGGTGYNLGPGLARPGFKL